MKVAFIAHLSDISGSGMALLQTAGGLNQKDIDGVLILPDAGPLYDRAKAMGLKTTVISNPEVDLISAGFTQKFKLLLHRLRYIRQLRKHLKSNGYTLAYINSSASVFAGFAAWSAGIPIAWHLHEVMNANSRVARVKAGIIRLLADGLLYASESSRESLPHPSPKPGLVVLNAVDTTTLLPIGESRIQGNSSTSPGSLLMNGTVPLKGADIALNALTHLLKDKPPPSTGIHLTITGLPSVASEFSDELKAFIAQHSLQNNVHFAGLQPSLIPLYNEATLYISASRTEALPIAIVEAMACGVPVIATDVGDCRRLLESGDCGWVVPPEDPAALADAIRAALQNPSLAREKATRAFEKIRRVYGSPDFWDPLTRFLQQLNR